MFCIGKINIVKMTVLPKASLVDQLVKRLLAMQETQVRFLGWEDLLEKGMAIHSSILTWRIPWTKEPGWLQSMGLQRVRHDCVANSFTMNEMQVLELKRHI